MNNIKDSTIKLGCLVGEALEVGYKEEATFIASYYFKGLINGSKYPFYTVSSCIEDIKQRNDSLYYLDTLSCDIVEEFNCGYDAFISVNLMIGVLLSHYSINELLTVEFDEISTLLEVSNLFNWRDIKHFEEVTNILKTVIIEYLQQLEVKELNKVLKQHFSIFNNTTIKSEFIYEVGEELYLVCSDTHFDLYNKFDKEELNSFIEDIILSFEFEDIQLLIEEIL